MAFPKSRSDYRIAEAPIAAESLRARGDRTSKGSALPRRNRSDDVGSNPITHTILLESCLSRNYDRDHDWKPVKTYSADEYDERPGIIEEERVFLNSTWLR